MVARAGRRLSILLVGIAMVHAFSSLAMGGTRKLGDTFKDCDSCPEMVVVPPEKIAMAITTDISPFFTRPWSLFFLIIAIFSVVYPLFQAHRGKWKWTLFYMPAACFAVSVPLYMMGGIPRPILATLVAALGAYVLWRRARNGWQLAETQADESVENG